MFFINPENITCGLSAKQSLRGRSMTEGNIFSRDKKTVIIVFIAWTCYQRQTKLFKFSQDTERKGLD